MEKKIKYCKIEEGRFENRIKVKYDDNSEDTLGSYYPDELIFAERSFIGLTKKQAIDFIIEASKNYVRS